ncbi:MULTISPECIES: acyl-CoA desaturase [unclassified Streptomyces]|uniref:acyl-CoA desaturase n=1 Tax=unclassified Streptomyces TaxID=2593676 RepID=UPI002E81124A|nr:acyl-CoA desaturase [Streptomyces sp. NBC_00589]WTI37736.1 acyl-CoA desaturase [Streptomyces sp. NBC_00775]WUB28585.1 acyl-CoA desaturase [Streptomyces sp. NBC_00589]
MSSMTPSSTTSEAERPSVVVPSSAAQPSLGYDGVGPFPVDEPAAPRGSGGRLYVTVTAVIVVAPFLALGLAGWLLWGSLIHPADILLALVLYTVTGLGVTVGFHRGLTHGGYRAIRPVRVALAVAGSMSFQGDVIGWVATHRRHHAFTDRPGDPHSPYRYGTHLRGQLRGLLHAHVGWLFRNDPTPAQRYAPDLLADRDIRAVSRAFPALCALTLVLPFAAGWAIGGTWQRALTALLWAGVVRIALLHHVTWSVNSLCHMIGERPFHTRRYDRATNLWPLALLSFGESWHNLHHADPTSARHGVDRGQLDPSAAVIRLLERLGWVSDVRWPTPDRVAARRV